MMARVVPVLFHPWIIFFLLPLLTFVFFFSFLFLRRKKAANAPPSPPGLPLLGNLHQLGALPHRSLRSLSEKYGPVMLLHFGHVPTVVVSSAEVAQEVMKTQDLIFASRPESSMTQRLLYDAHDVAFSPYGEYWRQVRRICVLHLLSIKKVQSFRSVREAEVDTMVGKIRSATSVASPRPVNLSELVVTLTNNITCMVAFGRKYSEDRGSGGNFRKMLAQFTTLLGMVPVGEFIPWLRWVDKLSGLDARVSKSAKEFDRFLEKVIEDCLQSKREGGDDRMSSGGGNFVDILLSLDEKDDDIGISLSRDHIKALILDMFAAGTETSYTAIEWAMAELIKHPKEMRRAQDEVRGIVGLKEEVGEELIDRMSYLKAVIKEALRLHAPVPLLVPRESMQDTQLLGYNIPAKTRVVINGWAIGRDPKSWERAEEFWPERFMNDSVDFKGLDFQFIPFGAGRGGCPGNGFAIPTIELVLANMLHHFDWEMPNAMKEDELDMTESNGITVHIKSGLNLVAKPRTF